MSDVEQIRKLIDGELSWNELRDEVLPDPKDNERFETTRKILQERVAFDAPILVPLTDYLHVTGAGPDDDGRRIKCACGHDFCGASENWKRYARVRVRESKDDLEELYHEHHTPHPEWGNQLREWFCPSCLAQLDVDAVPVGYPVKRGFEPDVDTFYEEWLDVVPPDRRA